MNVQLLFNFLTTKELSSVFLMSSDYDWLNENVFHYSEFYIGMKFEFESSSYTVKELRTIQMDGGPHIWSNEDHDAYRGEPYKSNMHIYFICVKE